MPRLRSTSTGVVVVVRDGKDLGAGWEPADVGSQPQDNTCGTCGYEAKSPGGLGSHKRIHKEG